MKKLKPLHPSLFRKKIDSAQLGFKTTKHLKISKKFIGQERALSSIQFGINIQNKGYNLYAMGPTGIGKHSVIHQALKIHAAKQPAPSDWCYIHNFEIPEKPIALKFPAGKGFIFQYDMKKLVEKLSASILNMFESREYRLGMKKIQQYIKNKHERKNKSIAAKKDRTPYPYKEQYEREYYFQNKIISIVLKPLIAKLKKKYIKNKQVIQYLTEVQNDIIAYIDELISHDKKTDIYAFSMDNPALVKYKVNLLVDNRELKHAPVIFDETPYYSNLISRVEYITQQGTLTTNFSLIRAGSLHQANGGYLIIEARKLIKNKHAWEALKNALYSKKIKIDPIQNMHGPVKTVSLEPMPIPFETKIILMGSRGLYYLLCQHDHDFLKLFKVAVDFDEDIIRNNKNIQLYARLIGTIAQEEKVGFLQASAVAEIINYSSRLAEDSEKLTTYISEIKDLILESAYWSNQENKKIIQAHHVLKAIETKIHRLDRVREIYFENIQRNFIIIRTEGKSIGQVNCLSVRRAGNFSFGHPTRVTARVRAGKGQFIDIQREIKLAGPFHSKAGLIITNFLASRFNPDILYSLSASVAFEQLYCWTDGDSASVGELCALLSALANVPIYQYLAVTGSIDQYGRVQPIGGVNEKIEGFFDICKQRGLNGKQGVIIPAVNTKNLMLREDIVTAAKANQFFIYPIKTINDAVTLMTGMPLGERDSEGHYAKNSFYDKVEKRLKEFANSVHKSKK